MRQILPFINLNGKITGQKSAGISILNEGFLYGKGIFTTIKVREGVLLFFERHLSRLETSALQLNILSPITYHLSPIEKAAYATIKKNKLINGGIRITITPATICIHAFTTSLSLRSGAAGEAISINNGIAAVAAITTLDTRDAYKTHKLTYRIPHLLAREKALSKGAEDALFSENNELIESTCANIFTCTPDNTIITPQIKEKGLNGITRQILIENLPVQEAPIPANTTNPLILVNSLNILIVESIDGRKINQNPEFVASIQQALEAAEKLYIENS